GGCRCQAYLLANDAAAAAPVCSKSPFHHVVTEPVERAQQSRPAEKPLVFRQKEESLTRSDPALVRDSSSAIPDSPAEAAGNPARSEVPRKMKVRMRVGC